MDLYPRSEQDEKNKKISCCRQIKSRASSVHNPKLTERKTDMTEIDQSTVYIIQQPRPKENGWTPNFEPATKYGKLATVFDAGDRAYADPTSARKKIVTKLANFGSEKDFLLWANFGDPACLWLTIMTLVATGRTKIKFLYWSRGKSATGMSNDNGFYFPVELDVTSISR